MPKFRRITHPNLTPARKQVFVRRLLKLRDILIAAPPEQYDHGLIMEKGDQVMERRGCGTAACAVGHAVLHYRNFPGLKVDIEHESANYVIGDLIGDDLPQWMEQLALENSDAAPHGYPELDPSADYYFGPWAWDYIFDIPAYDKPSDQVTKYDAIQRIQDYITEVLGCELIEETKNAPASP